MAHGRLFLRAMFFNSRLLRAKRFGVNRLGVQFRRRSGNGLVMALRFGFLRLALHL